MQATEICRLIQSDDFKDRLRGEYKYLWGNICRLEVAIKEREFDDALLKLMKQQLECMKGYRDALATRAMLCNIPLYEFEERL
jgi:hypothetical protein